MKKTIIIFILLLTVVVEAITFTEDFTSGIVDSVNWIIPLSSDTLSRPFSYLTDYGLLQDLASGDIGTPEYETLFKRELVGDFDVRLDVTLWTHTAENSLRGGLSLNSCDGGHRMRLFAWSGTETDIVSWHGSGHVFSHWTPSTGIEYISLDTWTGSFFDPSYYNFEEKTAQYRIVRSGDTFEGFRMGMFGWSSMGTFTDASWGQITEVKIFAQHASPDYPRARFRFTNFSAQCDTIRFKTCCTPDTITFDCVGDYLHLRGSGFFIPSLLFTIGMDSFYYDSTTMNYDGIDFWWQIPESVLSISDTIEIYYIEASNQNGCAIAMTDSIFNFATPYVDMIESVGEDTLIISDSSFELEFHITDTLGWILPESTFIDYEGIRTSTSPDSTGRVIFSPISGWPRGDTVRVILLSRASDGNCIEHYVADTVWVYLGICPTIDSVWFSEETDADNRNLVRVCYIANDADGDSFLVDFNVYDDTVSVPATTIYDTISGYPGNDTGWVQNGEHCFVWDMGADYPGYEGCDFDIQISIHNETTEMLTVTDSFPIPDAEGIAWDGQHLWVSRTHDVPGDSDTLVIYEVDPITHEILDSCAFLGNITGRYADMEWHNDTLWIMKASNYLTADPRLFVLDTSTCTMVDSSAQLYSSRWGQGIAWNNGYFWITDSHGQIYRVDPFSPYSDTFWMSIEDTFWAYHPAETLFSGSMTADAIVFALGYMWLLRNPTGSVTYILFQIDSTGQVVDSFELPAAGSYGPEGLTFDGSCFWYTDHTNDMVYRVCLWGCDDTLTVRGCLDSHLPEPQIDTNFCSDTFCCDDSLTSYLTVIDSFYNIPCSMCSLLVMCGTDTDTIITELTDSIITLPIDFPFCDSAYLVSVVYDSFGNRGVDTSCAFLIAPCAPVSLSVCPPYISYNSCINPAGIFHIEESDSTAIDTTAAFFTIYIYEDGVLTDSTCVNSPNPAIIWSGSEWNYDVSIFPSVADGDSVIITLDSLFNIYGCKIYP